MPSDFDASLPLALSAVLGTDEVESRARSPPSAVVPPYEVGHEAGIGDEHNTSKRRPGLRVIDASRFGSTLLLFELLGAVPEVERGETRRLGLDPLRKVLP